MQAKRNVLFPGWGSIPIGLMLTVTLTASWALAASESLTGNGGDGGTGSGDTSLCPVEGCEPPDPVCEPETCDGFDNDCDGLIDEGVLRTYYRDSDGDNYGAGAPLGTSCTVTAGQSFSNQDCNDGNAAVKPGAMKTCGIGACAASAPACVNGVEQPCEPGLPTGEECDRVDNDCDEQVDNLPALECGTGACARTAPTCSNLCWMEEPRDGKPSKQVCEWGAYGVCTPGNPTAEVCNNNIDEDCTGAADDSANPTAWVTFFTDRDNDGYGTSTEPQRACRKPANTSASAGDCDDAAPDVAQGTPDVCDGQDNDCNGSIDEAGVCRAAAVCAERGAVTLRGVSNKCLDADVSYQGADGAPMRLWDCHGGGNQRWTLQSDGTVQAPGGKCLSVDWRNGIANGTPVVLSQCTGTLNQKWLLQADGSLRGATGRCLDASWNDSWPNGTRTVLWACTGGINQKWAVVR